MTTLAGYRIVGAPYSDNSGYAWELRWEGGRLDGGEPQLVIEHTGSSVHFAESEVDDLINALQKARELNASSMKRT